MILVKLGSAATLFLGAAACPLSAASAAPVRQYGFALPSWSVSDYSSPQAPAYVRAIAATGAGWIQFTPTWYQPSVRASKIGRTEESASDASLRHIIGLAHGAGLKVLLKPHVDLPGDQDRAQIRPASPERWFASYRAFIGHYAVLAAQTGVAEFAVGTELAGVASRRKAWKRVIREVRARYDGPLVYAANYDSYKKVAFWDLLDLIGVDAYWPLADAPTRSVAALRRAWKPHVRALAKFSKRHRKRVLFTEAGYTSQRGTATAPYSWTVSRTRGNREQAAAYKALLRTFGPKDWWAGVHFWMWDDWPGSDETPRRLAFTPHGKPAERVVRRWFTSGQ